MKVLERNVEITEEIEDSLAEKYNTYMEVTERFENETGLEVVRALGCYDYCIIKNGHGKFIIGKIYKNCVSIGSGIIFEHNTVEEILNFDSNKIKFIEKMSKM